MHVPVLTWRDSASESAKVEERVGARLDRTARLARAGMRDVVNALLEVTQAVYGAIRELGKKVSAEESVSG